MTPTPNTTSATVQAWIGIAATAAPEVIAFVKSLIALKKKYPAMSTADIQVAVASITAEADTAFDDTLAKIAADQAAHPSA
jgi:hypothetical protein